MDENKLIADLEEENLRLRDRLGVAILALNPFVKIARIVAEEHEGWDHDAFVFNFPFPLTMKEFRDAAAARDGIIAAGAGEYTLESSINRMVGIADEARRNGVGIMDFGKAAKDAYDKAIEADPSWEGPIDGEIIINVHADEPE